MKVKVVSIFTDKHTRKTYSFGDVIEVTKDRYKEIKQHVEIIKDKKK